MGDYGVKQRYDRGADGVRRGGAILVHSCGDSGAVVKHCQLSTKLLGLACADRLGKIGKEGPEPGAILSSATTSAASPGRASAAALINRHPRNSDPPSNSSTSANTARRRAETRFG